MRLTLPHLSAEQRKEALAMATAARKRRAEIGAQLKNREMTLAEVIALSETDSAIAKMRVMSLLRALPRVGPQRARQALDDLGIIHTRRVQGLGSVQRESLVQYFENLV